MDTNLWYHAQIDRNQAESLLKQNGQFLVRSSKLTPDGQYVLSCYFNGQHLHFIILVDDDARNPNRNVYSFEGKWYSSVAELVQFHVNSGEPITSASQAVISQPVNRSLTGQLINSNESQGMLFHQQFSLE